MSVDDLEPFPGNPRKGDIEAIRASLRRFGQTRPVLVDSSGRRIIAGHHVRLAAQAEGWTHVAVVPNDFASEEEARAYLLADNRLADIGENDLELLVEQLRLLVEDDALDGTGYTTDDLDGYLAQLRTDPPVIGAAGQREHRDPATKELVLFYSPDQFAQLEVWLGIVAKEKGVGGVSETVYAAVEVAARTLNA